MEELNELVGLDKLKKDVKELVELMKVQKMREERGMKTAKISKHLVFSGNPGTARRSGPLRSRGGLCGPDRDQNSGKDRRGYGRHSFYR